MNTRTHQRRGLGRGLGALIPSGPRPDEEVDVAPDADLADDPVDTGDRTAGPAVAAGTSMSPPTPDWIGVPLPGDTEVADGPDGIADDDRADRSPGGETAGDPLASDGPVSVSEGEVLGGGGSQPGPGPADVDGAVDVAGGAAALGGSADAATAAPAATADAGLRAVSGAWYAELPVDEIAPNPRQPREVFDEDAMAELVASITEVGLLQPVVVRPVESGGYELVMGERRWRATRQAGLATIPAIVRDTTDDDLLRDALLENLHRSELNALEEAAAYQQLLDDFGCTHDELATRIGRSRPQISNTIRLLKLSAPVQRRVAAGVLSAGHARALLGVDDAALQDRLAGRVVAEGISVRGLEELVAVGEVGGTQRGLPRRRPVAPGVEDLAARLSDRLETRVKVDLGRRKGRITVEFASLPDLERIVALIDPEHPTRTRREETTS